MATEKTCIECGEIRIIHGRASARSAASSGRITATDCARRATTESAEVWSRRATSATRCGSTQETAAAHAARVSTGLVRPRPGGATPAGPKDACTATASASGATGAHVRERRWSAPTAGAPRVTPAWVGHLRTGEPASSERHIYRTIAELAAWAHWMADQGLESWQQLTPGRFRQRIAELGLSGDDGVVRRHLGLLRQSLRELKARWRAAVEVSAANQRPPCTVTPLSPCRAPLTSARVGAVRSSPPRAAA